MQLAKNYLTGHAKLCPTKDGKWTKAQLESKPFDKLHFTSETSVARKHPAMGLSVMAGTLGVVHATQTW